MSETEETENEEPKKSSKLPMIIGLVLAIAGGGGGFYAVYSGMLLGGYLRLPLPILVNQLHRYQTTCCR